MELGRQQREAEEDILRWFEGPDQVYYLGGWAGTGKTSLASLLASNLVGLENTAFAAFTGKAALRLRELGCPSASTVHSWIYHSRENSRQQLVDLKEELQGLISELQGDGVDASELADHPRVQQIEGLIAQEEKSARRPIFTLNPLSEVKNKDLGVLDEVSMVNEDMKRDWCSFGKKTLVLGDPFQLPPVGGEGAFTNRKPNYMLTEIHRQAEGNPIIALASSIRNMQYPQPKDWGRGTRVLRKTDLDSTMLRNIVMNSDQIIVGKNATRHSYNNRLRVLLGHKGRWPNVGEKIVCLRNNHEKGLLNGALYTVVNDPDVYEDIERIDMIVEPIGGGQQLEVHAHTHHFVGKEEQLKKMWFAKKDAEEFDFGYALTCHKTQGSQYKNPVIFDESYIAKQHRYNWLYTATTRAQESATLVL
jgi:Mesyanzhinovviridae Dda-like helicase